MKISNNTIKVLGFSLLAGIVGAATGLLFAPHKGSKTRRRLAKAANKIAGGFQETIKEEAEEVTSKIEKLSEQAKDAIGDTIKAAGKTLNGLTHHK